jgi:hypothetical protein
MTWDLAEDRRRRNRGLLWFFEKKVSAKAMTLKIFCGCKMSCSPSDKIIGDIHFNLKIAKRITLRPKKSGGDDRNRAESER